jgi:CheY-like chemotaxis protein
LLADDSATIQKVIDLTFRDEGLEVITVSDGQRAVELLEEIAPDIVLADVFMPGLNGYEVCEHIKRDERFRHIPVMLLVGSFEPFDEAEARRVGADDYLTKPFQSIRTLIGKVGNLLSGGGPSSSEEAPTRRLAPPPEAEKENRPDEEFLERSTADTAPLPQHERQMMERGGGGGISREGSFADLSMDDQMIETTPAENYGGGQPAREEQPQRQQPEPPHYARQTSQYSAADLKEAGITREAERARPSEREAIAYAPAQAAESSVPAAAGQSPSGGRGGSLSAVDDSLLDLGELEPPQAQAEADDFFLDLLDESPGQAQPRQAQPNQAQPNQFQPGQAQPGQAQPSAPSFPASSTADVAAAAAAPSAAEESDASARIDYEEATADAAPEAREFAGAGVFGEEAREGMGAAGQDASSAAPYRPTEDVSTSEPEQFFVDTQTAPTERLPDAFRVAEAPAARAETNESRGSAGPGEESRSGQIRLEHMSPEVIDAIARRVVEQLSERVVEQIAWEVVPELAERLIIRRLEQENKQ